jgi:TATA-box binding protein (TBP) (component of TFIID and TFIIIB)
MKNLEPKINNIKAHTAVNKVHIEDLKTALLFKEKEVHNNFVVVRDNYTYIIFPERGFINVTKIKRLDEIKDLKKEIAKCFSLELSMLDEDVVIDNITAAGDFGKRINLYALQNFINKNTSSDFTVIFNRDFFPGAFCKTYKYGTVMVFVSGKYSIVGAKCLMHVNKLFQKIYAHICEL